MRIGTSKHNIRILYHTGGIIEMNTRRIKGLALGLAMLSGVEISQARDSDKSEREYKELIEALDMVSQNAFMEAHGLNQHKKVYVYNLNGQLVLETQENTLDSKQYKIIFQSDLMMESGGDQYYITNKQSELNQPLQNKIN